MGANQTMTPGRISSIGPEGGKDRLAGPPDHRMPATDRTGALHGLGGCPSGHRPRRAMAVLVGEDREYTA